MSKLIKIGEQTYKTNGFKLEKTEETSEDSLDFTELNTELSNASLTDLKAKYEGKKSSYDEAKKKAQDEGSNEALTAQIEAKNELTVILNAYQIKSELAEQAKEEEPEELPETEAEPAEQTGGEKDGEENKEDEKVEEAEPAENLQPEIVEEKQLVTASGSLTTRELRNQPMFHQDQVMARQEKVVREPADFIVASANPYVEAETSRMSDSRMSDQYLSDSFMQLASESRGLSGGSSQKIHLGKYEVLTSPMIAAGGGDQVGNEFFTRGVRQDFNSMPAVTAAGELCDEDTRKVIPDCDFEGQDLTTMLQTYAAPTCNLFYYQDIPISELNDGVGLYDAGQKQAYCDARDAFKAAQIAGDAEAITAAMAELKAFEKRCTDAGCLPKVGPVVMEAVYRCISWSIEQQDCSPESVAVYRRKLEKLFQRAVNSHFLMNIEAMSKTVSIDAADPANGFVNADGLQLDAACVLDTVLTKMSCITQLSERIQDANYSIIVPRGMMKLLSMGQNRSNYSQFQTDFASFFSGYNVVETPDFAAEPGNILPDPLYPALPDVGPGEVCAYSDLLMPKDFKIYFFDPSSMFQIRRPDVSVSAQITNESVKGNWVAQEFFESFYGYGKDGCQPSYVLDLTNLCSNGAKVGPISPEGLCVV